MLKRFHFQCSSWVITLLVSLYMLAIFNVRFFSTVADLQGFTNGQDLLFMISMFLFLLVVINLLVTLFAWPWLFKPVVMVLLIASAFAAYFMQTYNVMIDKAMIQNVMETDVAETVELFNLGMAVYVLLLGVVPAYIVSKITITYGNPLMFVVSKATVFVVSLSLIGLISVGFYQEYASLFRTHRYVRNLIVPVNYIYSLQSYVKSLIPQHLAEYQVLAEDSHLGSMWSESPSNTHKKVVSILIVGETARSANFSLFDYSRDTNPLLKQQKGLITFNNFYSCGTSTAISVPCMFSNKGRSDFDNSQANYSDNILDVLQRSGLEVVWIDNNSGCKGVCDRVEKIAIEPDPAFCEDGECYDMAMLEKLDKVIAASDKDLVVVLHQKGSHGPAYFLRTPKEFQKYTPVCHTNQLQECSEREIINAYDNTILYTDYFISSVIDYLAKKSDQVDASLIYVSDHGESLGENNLYLHGLPYMLAPAEQTHVPMFVWMNKEYSERFSIDQKCLRAKSSDHFEHDNLFDSMLGMLNVKTDLYRSEMDIFNSCQSDGEKLRVTGIKASEK